MSIQADLYLFDNADWAVPLAFVDEDDIPYDFTGSTFRLDIKVTVDTALILSLTSGGAIAHTDLPNGTITPQIADGALAIGSYVYDLIRISGSARETLMFGKVFCEKGVSE